MNRRDLGAAKFAPLRRGALSGELLQERSSALTFLPVLGDFVLGDLAHSQSLSHKKSGGRQMRHTRIDGRTVLRTHSARIACLPCRVHYWRIWSAFSLAGSCAADRCWWHLNSPCGATLTSVQRGSNLSGGSTQHSPRRFQQCPARLQTTHLQRRS
jgi:hypothetical protein